MLHIFRDFKEEGEYVEALGFDIPIRRRSVGVLRLSSGHLVACDPIEHPTTEPFSIALKPGSYPVSVVVAELRDESRVAYAVIHVRPEPARRWEVATSPEEDTSLLSTDEYGYTVVSSLGCFMDVQAADGLLDALEEQDEEIDLFKVLKYQRDRAKSRGLSWANIEHEWLAPANLVTFSAGYGEGFYRTYVGRDAEGEISRIVTDFNVLDLRFPSFPF